MGCLSLLIGVVERIELHTGIGGIVARKGARLQPPQPPPPGLGASGRDLGVEMLRPHCESERECGAAERP